MARGLLRIGYGIGEPSNGDAIVSGNAMTIGVSEPDLVRSGANAEALRWLTNLLDEEMR
jgi:hypothetical protein